VSGQVSGQSRSLLERTTDGLRGAIERIAWAEESGASRGLLQRLDPRVKVVGLASLIVATAMSTTVTGILAILGVGLALAAGSRLSARRLAWHVWLPALAFSGAIALPALVLTPGQVLFRLPALNWPITLQGLTSALYLVLRVTTAVTLTALLVFTTLWTHVLKALRSLGLPVVFVVILGMTFRYVLLLLETAHEMFESRRSRLVGRMAAADSRRLATATAGVLLSRTMDLGTDVHLAMQARGFRGELYVLHEPHMGRRDWVALLAFAATTAAAIWIGR
jgi:cobalt/nickel transport system permease protein